MKFKKAIAAIAAAAMALSAMSFSTSAADGIMDFEDGVIIPEIAMVPVDANNADSASGELSIVDYNGSKMLKFAIADGTTQVGKIRFDMTKLFGADIVKINSIKVDIYVESGDLASPTQWAGGWLRSMAYNADGSEFTAPTTSQWEGGTYSAEDGFATPKIEHELKWLLSSRKYKADAPQSWFDILKFAQSAAPDNMNFYVDNVRFLDADGNGVPFTTGGAAAAPAADAGAASTTAPATGNAPIAIAAAVVLVAGVSMIVSRKRK